LRRVVPWLPVAALALALFWASAQSNLRFEPDEFWDTAIRKTGHVIVYATGTLFLWYALNSTTRLRPPWAWAAGIAVAFAASDELHQVFTKGREPTIRDVLIDAIGIVIAVVVGRLWLARRAMRSGPPTAA
jgi:VanZ family protein